LGEQEIHVVTGALSYTGKYIARRLLERGVRVRTLTGHPDRPNPFGADVEVRRLQFDDRAALVSAMRGATTLCNTYWIRFEHGAQTFKRAVANSRLLFAAAAEAGVRRLVHVSIANPARRPDLPYYRGKATLEETIRGSSLSYAILRPAVVFGDEDVLLNNIAWLVRRFPVFGIPGDGQYGMQPIFVEDLAALAVESAGGSENVVVDAVGPETFTFNEVVRLLARTVGSRARLIHLPPQVALRVSQLIGLAVRDVILTPDEVKGLTADLLVTDSPATGSARLTDWLREHADTVGRRYASELGRHYR
jgi:NADH dehydrogenase